jgi:hypothetical protein
MKKIFFSLIIILFFFTVQCRNTSIFTVFTSKGCGCTGSGGAPVSFMTNEQVIRNLEQECGDIDFSVWEGTLGEAYDEMQINMDRFDGVLIIGNIDGDYRLAFTGLPTIVVYNLWEFMNQPYHLFATGRIPEEAVLKGGVDYNDVKILTAQLDRRNLCAPSISERMFRDLVYKIKLIRVIQEMKETRILMVKNAPDEIIAQVNYRGDINQSFPDDHNERYIHTLKEIFGTEIIQVEAAEFFETYKKIKVRDAEEVAEKWIDGARKVEASKPEIIKTAVMRFQLISGQYPEATN